MDGTKGFHALGAGILGLLIIWLSNGWFTFFNNDLFTDVVARALLWGSYLWLILLVVIIGPLFIAFRDESDVTLLSILMGFTSYFAGVLVFIGTWEFFNRLIGIFSTSDFIQLVWGILIILYACILFFLPVALIFYPETFKRLALDS